MFKFRLEDQQNKIIFQSKEYEDEEIKGIKFLIHEIMTDKNITSINAININNEKVSIPKIIFHSNFLITNE